MDANTLNFDSDPNPRLFYQFKQKNYLKSVEEHYKKIMEPTIVFSCLWILYEILHLFPLFILSLLETSLCREFSKSAWAFCEEDCAFNLASNAESSDDFWLNSDWRVFKDSWEVLILFKTLSSSFLLIFLLL